MTHTNRGRLTVNIGGDWRLYTQTIPTGAEAVGTVTRDETDTGALVLNRTGIYAQVNAGAMRSLDQRKIWAAIQEPMARCEWCERYVVPRIDQDDHLCPHCGLVL